MPEMKLAPVVQLCDYENRPDFEIWRENGVKGAEMRARLERLKSDGATVSPVYAVATRTFRCYGGPEEGGWWYDWTDIEQVCQAYTFRGLLATVRRMREEHETDQRGRGSVLGNRGDVTIYLTRHAHLIDGLQSTERPRYE